MRLHESSARYPNVTPVLYHYPMSPYSEKLRLAMGLSGIAWASIQVSPQPPRGTLDQILGGYRRIPVLQRGAHFYCEKKGEVFTIFEIDIKSLAVFERDD